jgi:hypothetical protein
VSKTNKGYQTVGEEIPSNKLFSHTTTADDQPEEPRAQVILDRLRQTLQRQRPYDEVGRTLWRAGELELKPAAVLIGQMVGKGDELLDYSIAWSLGRCGDATQLPVLSALRKQYGEHFVGAMAREAQLALMNKTQREVIFSQIEEALPDMIQRAIKSAQVAEILSALELLVPHSPNDAPNVITGLYVLALEDDNIRQALLRLLPSLPSKPNTFKAVRRLFKVAEFRQDTQVFGRITHLMGMAYPCYYSEYHYYQAIGSASHLQHDLDEKSKKTTPTVACSSQTRDYFNRRGWRTLRRLAELGSKQYVTFAAEILLAVSDADARVRRDYVYYDYKQSKNVTLKYDHFSHLFAFNHILNHLNPQMRLTRASRYWMRDTWAKEPPDLRCEAYPELWNQAPEMLLRLLTQSQCNEVHTFALRALKCNKQFVRTIGGEPVRAMLIMPYESTALFALELAKKLLNPSNIDNKLISALLRSPVPEAHELAQRTLRSHPSALSVDADLIYLIITSKYEDNRLWIRRFIADYPLRETTVEPLSARLIAGVIQLGREDDDTQTVIIEDITWILINSFAETTRGLGFDVMADLLNEASVVVQLLGAKLLLNHTAPAEALPPGLLRKMLEAPSSEVRALGTQLFGRLSDEVLLTQPELVLKLALSHNAQVRQAAEPVIQRLAQTHPAFATLALERLIDSLFRGEPVEGFHNDILKLVKETLAFKARSVDITTTWRLLRAHSKGAQRYGAHLLEHALPEDFSVRQLGRLAGNPLLSVRQWAWRGYEQQADRIKANVRDALVIFDTQWEDTRRFAKDFFDRHFSAKDWDPEILIAICDSTWHDVEDYGRQLITRFFDEQQGIQYLLKLSQHPSNKVQLFVSQLLPQYAADNIDHLQKLRHYFLTVLSKVNQARATKSRVTDFLHNEAMKSLPAARFVVDLFSRQSVTSAIVDKTASIKILLGITQHYPELDAPLKRLEAKVRTSNKPLRKAN